MSLTLVSVQIPNGLQQFLENSQNGSNTNSLLQFCNGNLYYVTLAQVGVSQATKNLRILRSSDQGVTWTLVADTNRGYTSGFQSLALVVSGTQLLIATGRASDSTIRILTFNCGPDTFSADSTASADTFIPASGGIGLVVFSDGSVVAAGGSTGSGNEKPQIARYVPGVGWSAGVGVEGATTYAEVSAAGFCVQGTTDRAYLFYVTSPDGTNWTLKCISVTKPTTLGSVQTLTTLVGNAIDPASQYLTGYPCVSSSQFTQDFRVNIPVLTSSGLTLYRATCAANPAFTGDLIDTGPPGQTLGTFGGSVGWPSPIGACISWPPYNGGTVSPSLYILYSADNGGLNSALSQAFLYVQTYQSSYSGRQLVQTSPLSREPLAIYPCVVSAALLAFIWGLANPIGALDAVDPETKINALSLSSLANANQFSLEKVVAAVRPDKHMPVRGSAQ